MLAPEARENGVPTASRWMRQALDLARLADYRTSPNPMVGAVLVRNGEVVGAGYHRRAGEPHAEAEALGQAGERARGADLYVTLEPCTHHGRTGPCAPAVIAAGVRRVIAAMPDPNPPVNGTGIRTLREAGVAVQVGDGAEEAAQLNRFFCRFVSIGRPFVSLKYAMSLDGRIATDRGESRWISGPQSRRFAHELRHQHDVVLVGVNTVIDDDPQLTVRDRETAGEPRQPLRVVLDSRLRIPESAALLRDGGRTLIATTAAAPSAKQQTLGSQKVEIQAFPEAEGRVDLGAVLSELARRQHISVLIEGGAAVHAAALKASLVDELCIFVAPVILGSGLSPVGPLGIERLVDAPRFSGLTARALGPDILLQSQAVPDV